MKKRVALLGIYHETNTFLDTTTSFERFREGYWLAGGDILREYRGAHHEISGIIGVLEQCGDMELVPVFYTSATPAGTIEDDAYRRILDELFSRLEEAFPVDGCIVTPHGAGVVASYPDMDGHWLSLLRERVGPDLPIIGTLDPHANVSPLMASVTNALIPYSTNPHVDQAETGRVAARLMVRKLRGEISPVQHLRQLPLAISIEQQSTLEEPGKGLRAFAAEVEAGHGLLSARVLLGFPYADVEEMGSGFLVAGEDEARCREAADVLAHHVLGRYRDFNGPKNKLDQLLPSLAGAEGPVLLLDMGDNVGGGAPGNSTYLLRGLEAHATGPVFCCIYDPEAVTAAGRKEPGGSAFEITFGSPGWTTRVQLLRLADGRFTESSPRHGGFVNFNMGRIAVLKTAAGNTVMLTSKRCEPYSLRQLTAFDLEPADFRFLIAKGVNAPIAAYREACRSMVRVDTPGPTGADMTSFTYARRRRPMFPFEDLTG